MSYPIVAATVTMKKEFITLTKVFHRSPDQREFISIPGNDDDSKIGASVFFADTFNGSAEVLDLWRNFVNRKLKNEV